MYIKQKKITYAEAEEVFHRLNSLVNVSVGAANTIAGRCLYDARELLMSDRKLFRHKVKMCANGAVMLFRKYESLHLQNFGDRYQLFLDYLDSIEDAVMPHVSKFYWSVKSVLDKNNEPDSALKAKVETARTMTDYACHVYDLLLDSTRGQTGFDFDCLMRPARLTGVLHAWEQVTGMICKSSSDTDIDFNADANCRLAFDIIDRILTSEETMGKAGYEALKLNPELARRLVPEDFEAMREKFEGT